MNRLYIVCSDWHNSLEFNENLYLDDTPANRKIARGMLGDYINGTVFSCLPDNRFDRFPVSKNFKRGIVKGNFYRKSSL